VAVVRLIIAKHTKATNIGPVSNDTCTTPIRADLLESWQNEAHDPDTEIGPWLREGAPGGILNYPKPCGFFPEVVDESAIDLDELEAGTDMFENYAGIDDDTFASDEITKHIKAGHLLAADSIEELAQIVGGAPILNKVGIVVKERAGIVKRRLILNTKLSNVKLASRKCQRVILPRLLDAVLRTLALMACITGLGLSIDLLVLDFTEAFWQIPIAPNERRFFGGMIPIDGVRKYFVYLRAAQGSRCAPLLWGRVAALVMRLTQSLFVANTVALMCFVDDPLAVLSGTPLERKLYAAVIVLVWEALGFGLAFKKGQFGKKVTWIGGTFSVDATGITASVKQSIIDDIIMDLERFSMVNIISLKELHSFVGKVNHAAGLLPTLRPFIQPLWAALHDKDFSNAPNGTIWKRQIDQALTWLSVFFRDSAPGIVRRFDLKAFQRIGPTVEVGTDASPWGLGGWLAVDSNIVE
jgi:hypothetical protein